MMNKSEMLENIRQEHARMEALLSSLDQAQLVAPILDNGWSIKDHIAHLVAWEKLMLGWVESSTRGQEPVRFTPEFVDTPENGEETMQRLNDRLYVQNRSRSPGDVLKDFRDTHTQVVEQLSLVSETDLFDPDRFPWRKGTPLIATIAGNTYEHYQEHYGWITTALAKESK
jgi:hypothetical protein